MTCFEKPVSARVPRRAGFTLIEVILAVLIAVGLLTVVLVFYRQAAELRGQVIAESERLSAVRLVMTRLTDELRTVSPRAGTGVAPLVGNAQALRLIRAAVPARIAWEGGDLGRSVGADSDLVVVSYRATPGTNAPGLYRREEVLVGPPRPVAAPASGDDLSDTNAVPDTVTAEPPESAQETNGPVESRVGPAAGAELLLTEALPFARFRFWDGAQWQASWADSRLPRGVEIILALEMPPADAPPGSLPEDYFRRVVVIPAAWGGGGGGSGGGTVGADADAGGGDPDPSDDTATGGDL